MSPLLIQRLIALPFIVLGGWCLFFPGMVEQLTLTAAYQHNSATTSLLIGCFGAQAVLSGLFAAFSRFTKTTFLVYAIALLPFFWFNYWFVFVVPMFNAWLALDFVSNLVMLALCVLGWRKSARLA
ncbi:MAG: hypothetical protein EPN98_07465 [Phenylobacterium sp.]|uniref:hypothetical protein n=1 Tax=Phenylobacterium sp. TaxID=1871053 RepID=UPI00121149F9|nr:hypothetical protein [Phenylobacterium sp.]TAL35102.1 MAG: hypothetical protein EPN98_07465 [Phenylobacterium sp.]